MGRLIRKLAAEIGLDRTLSRPRFLKDTDFMVISPPSKSPYRSGYLAGLGPGTTEKRALPSAALGRPVQRIPSRPSVGKPVGYPAATQMAEQRCGILWTGRAQAKSG